MEEEQVMWTRSRRCGGGAGDVEEEQVMWRRSR